MEEEESDEDRQMITVTEGYSKDHRPDLKQTVVTLITSQASSISVWL
jgi:transposase